MMRVDLLKYFTLYPCALALAANAQTHAVKKPDTVVRAVSVYEWTGELGKAKASRIVPVSLFINKRMQDAGIYMARPVPFALDTGTIYEAQKSGVTQGNLELSYERHLASGDAVEIDDGWLGYGPFKPKPKETLVAATKSGPLPKVHISGGSSSDSDPKPADPKDTTRPDRPTFHRNPNAGQKPTDTSTASTTPDATDPEDGEDKAERPTLKHRTPSEIKADQKKRDTAKVTGGTSLNDDPDRPNLHRGKPASRMEEDDIPPLHGTPKDMQQMIAVSDARDRPEHDFERPWDNDAERLDILGKMQALAREKLAAYSKTSAPTAAPAKAAAPKTTAAKTTAASHAKRRVPVTPPPIPLTEETLKGFTLSYGGDPTYVYTASSLQPNGASLYVLVVAQQDAVTGLKVALASATDSTHLDRTPWMRLVDAVDADASNRASLLLELRAQHTRQFALYRVIGAQAEQLFATGSTE